MKRTILLSLLCTFWLAASSALAAGLFQVGEKAPPLSLNTLAGEAVSLEAQKGKVVVLGLFHICEPCLIQGSALQKVHEAFKGKSVAVVGVNSSGNNAEDVQEFLAQFPVTVTYPYLLDPKKVTDKLYGGGKFIPNVYVIDQQGTIRWQRVGNMNLADDQVIIREVEKLLGGKPGAL